MLVQAPTYYLSFPFINLRSWGWKQFSFELSVNYFFFLNIYLLKHPDFCKKISACVGYRFSLVVQMLIWIFILFFTKDTCIHFLSAPKIYHQDRSFHLTDCACYICMTAFICGAFDNLVNSELACKANLSELTCRIEIISAWATVVSVDVCCMNGLEV